MIFKDLSLWFVPLTKPREIAWHFQLDFAALVIVDNLNVVVVMSMGAPKLCLASSALTKKGNAKEMLDLAESTLLNVRQTLHSSL